MRSQVPERDQPLNHSLKLIAVLMMQCHHERHFGVNRTSPDAEREFTIPKLGWGHYVARILGTLPGDFRHEAPIHPALQ
jgi:hypothetical protein